MKKVIICFLVFESIVCSVLCAMDIAVQGSISKNVVSTRDAANNIALRLQQLQAMAQQNNQIDHLVESFSQPAQQKLNKGKDDVVTTTTTTQANPVDTIEAQMMNVIQKVNPVLMQFGQDHNVAIPDLLKYAQILQEYHIDPAGIAAFINQSHNLSPAASQDLEQHYTAVQANNPNQYMQLMLSCIKTIEDEMSGKSQTASHLHTSAIDGLHQTHTAQQENITQLKDTVFKGKLGYIVHGLVTLGVAAWGLYGQIHQDGSAVIVNATM